MFIGIIKLFCKETFLSILACKCSFVFYVPVIKQLQTGDYIDLLEREGGKTAVKRVRVVKVNTILRKNKEKREVYVRAWRGMNFFFECM